MDDVIDEPMSSQKTALSKKHIKTNPSDSAQNRSKRADSKKQGAIDILKKEPNRMT